MFESRPPPRSSPPGFGEPAPFFTAPTDGNPAYSIQVAAGRWMVLQAFISLAGEDERAQHDLVLARRGGLRTARRGGLGGVRSTGCGLQGGKVCTSAACAA